jgi:hypothetical protein
VAAASASQVGSIWVQGNNSIVGGRHQQFVWCRWVVELHFSCVVLYVPLLDKHDIVGPILRQILGTEDVFKLLTQAMVKSCLLCYIIPIKVHDYVLELWILCDKVLVSLM